MNEFKKCECCEKPLIRKRFPSGRLESNSAFRKRRYCSLGCANTRKSESKVLRRQQATSAAADGKNSATSATTAKKTALQILEEAANDESLDWHIRVTAAKALAPYQAKRVGESQGKKAEQVEAAGQVATGNKFAPSAPPKVVPIR